MLGQTVPSVGSSNSRVQQTFSVSGEEERRHLGVLKSAVYSSSSARYDSADRCRHLYKWTASLNWILSGALSQCSCWRSGVMWSYLDEENRVAPSSSWLELVHWKGRRDKCLVPQGYTSGECRTVAVSKEQTNHVSISQTLIRKQQFFRYKSETNIKGYNSELEHIIRSAKIDLAAICAESEVKLWQELHAKPLGTQSVPSHSHGLSNTSLPSWHSG